MSRGKSEQLLTFLDFSDYSQTHPESVQKKKKPAGLFFCLISNNYQPKQQLSVDEGKLPIQWRGRLKFRIYDPSKLTKYMIHLRQVCESDSGYILNMEIHNCGPQSVNVYQ